MDLQYLEAGSGPPLLLVHGHEQSATSWRWVIPALARTHRVLALSLPGHGDSAPAVGGYAPGRDLAPLVADFLDTLGVGPLHVVGNSVGGAVALRLALADPARVRTLTLVGSAGLGRDVHPLLALDTLPMIGELAIMISRMPGGDVGRTSMSTAMLFAQPSRVPAEFFTEQHALGRRPGQLEASTAMARALFDVNGQREVLLDQLPTLTMPTLVVWGGLRLRPARLPGPGRGGPPAPRAARAVRRLRTPAPRGVPRPVRHRPERVARRAPRLVLRGRPWRHPNSPPHHRYPTDQPDPGRPAGSEAYRSQAGRYDRRTDAFRRWRELVVEQLPARPGDTVLDVGCGTGLCLPLLQRKVGPSGTIVGIDASAQMLEVAAARVTEHGWDNVHLLAAPVAQAPIDRIADAALFCAVHDVLQSPAALTHVFAHLRPGAAVAAIGGKWPPTWNVVLRAWVADLHAPFISDFTGFDQPWRLLAGFVPDLRVTELGAGAGYLAVGHARGPLEHTQQ